MAQLSQQFDASEVEPRHPNEVRPAGWYACYPSASEMKPTKDNSTEYLSMEYTCYEPAEFAGTKFFDNLNINHGNPVVQEIAYRTLSAICHATGVLVLNDTEELHEQPLAIRIAYVPPEKDEHGKIIYSEKNEVKDYRPVDEVEIGITAPLPEAAPAEPKEQKAKPATKAAATTTAKPWEKAAAAKAPVTKTVTKAAPAKSKPVVEEEEVEEEEEEAAPKKATPPWAKKK